MVGMLACGDFALEILLVLIRRFAQTDRDALDFFRIWFLAVNL